MTNFKLLRCDSLKGLDRRTQKPGWTLWTLRMKYHTPEGETVHTVLNRSLVFVGSFNSNFSFLSVNRKRHLSSH